MGTLKIWAVMVIGSWIGGAPAGAHTERDTLTHTCWKSPGLDFTFFFYLFIFSTISLAHTPPSFYQFFSQIHIIL